MFNLGELIAQFNAWAISTVEGWGYFGIFLVSLIGNASIIFPVPSYLIVIAFGGILNPWLVGLAAGTGAALGELTGYAIGRGGKRVIEKKHEKLVTKAKFWMEKHGLFPILVLFAATPLPDDIVGILGGIVSYNIKKFLLATFIGKVIANVALAWAGYFGGQLLGESGMIVALVISVIFLVAAFKFLAAEKKQSLFGRLKSVGENLFPKKK